MITSITKFKAACFNVTVQLQHSDLELAEKFWHEQLARHVISVPHVLTPMIIIGVLETSQWGKRLASVEVETIGDGRVSPPHLLKTYPLVEQWY